MSTKKRQTNTPGSRAVREYRVDKAPRYEPMSEGTSGG